MIGELVGKHRSLLHEYVRDRNVRALSDEAARAALSPESYGCDLSCVCGNRCVTREAEIRVDA